MQADCKDVYNILFFWARVIAPPGRPFQEWILAHVFRRITIVLAVLLAEQLNRERPVASFGADAEKVGEVILHF